MEINVKKCHVIEMGKAKRLKGTYNMGNEDIRKLQEERKRSGSDNIGQSTVGEACRKDIQRYIKW